VGALAVLFALLAGLGCGGQGAPRAPAAADAQARSRDLGLDLPRAAMQADLDYWFATLEAVHPDPYAKIPRAAFHAELAAARARLPESADPFAFYAVLQRLAAMLHDSHTDVWYPRDTRAYRDAWWPVETVVRDGRLFVATEHAGLAKATEITKVNQWPSSVLLRAATALTSAESQEAALYQASFSIGAALWLAGGRAPFHVEGKLASGSRVNAELAGQSPLDQPPPQSVPPFELNWTDSNVARLVIRAMNDVDGFARFIEAAAADLVLRRAQGLIVDLRENYGGDTTVGELLLERIIDKPYRIAAEKWWRVSEQYRPLARENYGEDSEYLAAPPGTVLRYRFEPRRPKQVSLRYTGPVCFLIGPNTASSAMMLANAVEDYQLAPLIGEPTTSPPNYFGEVLKFDLPRTKLRAQSSVARFVRANGDASNPHPVRPNIALAPTVEQWARGEDPVLARALEWIATGR